MRVKNVDKTQGDCSVDEGTCCQDRRPECAPRIYMIEGKNQFLYWTHGHIHMHMHTHTQVHTHIRMHTHRHTNTGTHTPAHIQAHTWIEKQN